MNEKNWKTQNPDFIPGEELNSLREKFIQEYSKKKGWDEKNLSSVQMLEIVSQSEYKNPGMIRS